jgi:two-component system chemotaxis sensor kinase CheA
MDFDQELLDEFTVESLEHLDAVEPLLLALETEGGASTDDYNSIFRALHSIKGAAGFLGLDRIQALSHVSESLLMRLRDGERAFEPAMADPLLQVVDTLRALLGALPEVTDFPQELHDAIQALIDGEAPGPGAAAPREDRPRVRFGEVAVDLGYLRPEQVHELLGAQANLTDKRSFGTIARELGLLDEVQLKTIGAEQALRMARAKAAAAVSKRDGGEEADDDFVLDTGQAAPRRAAGEKRTETIRVAVPLLDKLIDLAGELVLSRNQLRQRLEHETVPGVKNILQRMDLITSELQENIMYTRMQPMRGLLDKLPRQVRDVSGKLGKKVELFTVGGDVELDRSILEALSDPLTHLIRNSLDHGIEAPADRAAAGKPESGTLSVRAFHESGQVIVEISDDGRGIDGRKVLAKAVERGAVGHEEAAAMDEREAIQLIFHPGLSTAEQVTDVSGRGVGMDVVRTNIQQLGGQIDLESEVGRGTTVRIRLPLTLAIIPSLIVAVEGERFAIPQVNLIEVLRLRPDELDARTALVHGVRMLRLRDEMLPLVGLAETLGIERADAPRRLSVIVLRADNNSFGLVVDELHDNEEIVVKPLSRYTKACTWFAGATILGDGAVAMILDGHGLLDKAGLELRRLSDAARVAAQTDRSLRGGRSMIVFDSALDERFALPLGQIQRLERIDASAIERVGHREFVQYRGQPIPVLRLEQLLPVAPLEITGDSLYVLIPRAGEGRVGILASRVVDTLVTDVEPEPDQEVAPGQLGKAILDGQLTLFLDCEALVANSGLELPR